VGAGYDIVLVVHVLVAALALGSTVTTAVLARLASRSATARTAAVERYFRSGTNWAERILVVVPVPGYALVSMSHGRITFGEAWLVAGTLLWALALALALVVAWPAEELLQRRLHPGQTAPLEPGTGLDERGPARRLALASALTAALLLAAFVVMVAQPGGHR
jgi:uncharacterized membrane protein